MNQITSIKQLIQEAETASSDKYGEVLKRVNFDAQYIEDICVWRKAKYTRNVIKQTANYELLFLCWESNQCSSIHTHSDGQCWVSMIKGKVIDNLYSFKQSNNGIQDIKFHKNRTLSKETSTEPLFISDKMNLMHSIQNLSSDRAITLHLYAKPIKECYAYNPTDSVVTIIRLKHDYIIDLSL